MGGSTQSRHVRGYYAPKQKLRGNHRATMWGGQARVSKAGRKGRKPIAPALHPRKRDSSECPPATHQSVRLGRSNFC
jgi:hypothetical protein